MKSTARRNAPAHTASRFQERIPMNFQHSRAALLFPVLALAACATTNQPMAVPTGAEPMHAPALSTLLSRPVTFDNGVTGGMRYEFEPGGKVAYSMRLLPLKKRGAWKLEDDRLCINVDDAQWECGNFYRLTTTQYLFDLPGYDRQYNTLSVR
jgi:hypothetical protein